MLSSLTEVKKMSVKKSIMVLPVAVCFLQVRAKVLCSTWSLKDGEMTDPSGYVASFGKKLPLGQ